MTTRRGFVTSAVGLIAGGAVSAEEASQFPVAAHPDAALLEACAAFDRLERSYVDLGGDWPAGSPEEDAAEEARSRISDDQTPFVERICELVAVTREGEMARARSLALWNPNLLKDGPGDAGECLTAAIVRDLIGGAA